MELGVGLGEGVWTGTRSSLLYSQPGSDDGSYVPQTCGYLVLAMGKGMWGGSCMPCTNTNHMQ